ncbi:MAG: DEAD/DEAH box helicase family protein [Paludibacteraceae bacterium]|nr:DEAD/DEAH box helicase family protein [Paludibacteraceae bacterium]
MDESTTRRKKIDPALYAVGWEQDNFPSSAVLNEQRAYEIAPGRVDKLKTRRPKKVDYVLEYKGIKLAVIEAKSDETDVSIGVPQAKQYAQMLQIRYAFSTNGDEVYFIDMGVQNASGEYIIPSTEKFIDAFPSPDELWQMTFPDKNEWRDKFIQEPFNIGGGRKPRYYQEIAVNNVLTAISKEQNRILLTLATGTGKTYIAFQICWKLFYTNWNIRHDGKKPRILFITDRNVLANQASNDFEQFPDDAIVRITPEWLRKHEKQVPTSRHLYFTIFNTYMGLGNDGKPYYTQYPTDFFDLIIIDECHRGGANDESQWRELMDYFKDAYQLGLTATPKRAENANTYRYFGEPVYSYSLKQGIADGFLTPFRVCISNSNIDEYQYDPSDDVEGDIDPKKKYTEQDFYNGKIEIKQRDEHRVIELLKQIDPNDKTIVFCATQVHASIICAMINQHKSNPSPDYCKRVTCDDGKEGEEQLKHFQNNDRTIPTILTTSKKLSTGVDARNVRNIVLMRPINNMVEFKQIIGRGTRIFDEKYYFTIYDFVGANKNFKDAEWDGDPFCPICGNYPCTCNKAAQPIKAHEQDAQQQIETPNIPQPCSVCGHLPCTCPAEEKITKIKVKLSPKRELSLRTNWTEAIQFGDEILTLEQFIKKLFGQLPNFFNSPEDLRKQWEHPNTRQALLEQLEREGFSEDKLDMIRRVMQREDCDLFDILEYLAYETTPLERKRRIELVKEDYYQTKNMAQKAFLDFLMLNYINNGHKELTMENLPLLINMKYGTPKDAIAELNMSIPQIQKIYLELQHEIYKAKEHTRDVHLHFYSNGAVHDDHSRHVHMK